MLAVEFGVFFFKFVSYLYVSECITSNNTFFSEASNSLYDLLLQDKLLLGVVVSTFGHILWDITGQAVLIHNFPMLAGNETGVAIDASDEASALSRNGEAWVRPELVRKLVRGYLVWATEADNLFGVALIQKQIWPVARVSLVIVGQAWLTWGFIRDSPSTLDIASVTSSSLWVESKLVQASRG